MDSGALMPPKSLLQEYFGFQEYATLTGMEATYTLRSSGIETSGWQTSEVNFLSFVQSI